jgi:phosphatidylinositol-3-phosphatase
MGRRAIRGKRRGLGVAPRLAGVLTALLCAVGAGAVPASAAQPTIHHVFVIVLENESYDTTFGPSPPSAYLAKTLPAQGALLKSYYGIGHESLDNYIAMISGQPPNAQTQSDCQFFSSFPPFPGTTTGSDGIVNSPMGGCVFPAATQTVVNQLDSDGLSWRAYAQDMANGQPTSCRHPNVNSQDSTQSAKPNDQYAARHVPFVYFHSIIDTPACASDVVDLNQLPGDLRQEQTTPNYSFITPDLCADGHDASCPDGSPGGYAGIDRFLREWVPRITGSPAYQDRGLLLIAFDEADTSDASACCNEQSGPNTPNPGGPTPGPGGGRVGAVALSPCIAPGTTSTRDYNHYSQLRWVEDNFGLPRLGYAAQAGLSPFGSDVFTQPGCEEQPQLKVKPRHPRAGKRTSFRFRIDSPLDRCKVGVDVSFAGKQRKTNANGIARIRKRFSHKGVRVARAKAPTCDLASKRVRIKAPR